MVALNNVVLQGGSPVVSSYRVQQFMVYKTSRNTAGACDGGCCCCWVYPTGTTWAIFEVWSAGGDGPGACCCQGPYMNGGTGQYTKKYVSIGGANCFFTICSAGSGCCSQPCCGTCGFPSFVLNYAGSQVVCASGGSGGCSVCHHMGGQACTGICTPTCMKGCSSSGDFNMPTMSAPDHQSNFCTSSAYTWLHGPTKLMNNTRHSGDTCTVGMTAMGCCYFYNNHGMFPGGGGNSGQACGGPCCWGAWGIGGLVLVTYGS